MHLRALNRTILDRVLTETSTFVVELEPIGVAELEVISVSGGLPHAKAYDEITTYLTFDHDGAKLRERILAFHTRCKQWEASGHLDYAPMHYYLLPDTCEFLCSEFQLYARLAGEPYLECDQWLTLQIGGALRAVDHRVASSLALDG